MSLGTTLDALERAKRARTLGTVVSNVITPRSSSASRC